MAQWLRLSCWILCAFQHTCVKARNVVGIKNKFQLNLEVTRKSAAVNSTTVLASSQTNSVGGSRNVPPDVREILERHARREKARRNATPGADEMVTLRLEAVDMINDEYDELLEHVAQSLASFVGEKSFAADTKLSEKEVEALEKATILAVADELEPRFDRMSGLVGGLYDKAKPHKRREFVADLKKYVPDYLEGQHGRVWNTVRFHLMPPGTRDEKKFEEKLEQSGEYIEKGMEDYIELSYYSNLMLHGRNSSKVNQTQLAEDLKLR